MIRCQEIMPKDLKAVAEYFKGVRCPKLADLTDTELVSYGP
jgi:hypothetical protein